MGIDDLDGGCSSGAESCAVITKKVQAGSHGLIVQMVEVCQLVYVFLLDGKLERSGEDRHYVVSLRLRGFGGGWRG